MTEDFWGKTLCMRIILSCLALLILAACATLTESECQTDNWFEIGKSDGARGRSLDFIFEHAKACNEFGIAPKAEPWRAGRIEGLKTYCTPRNAYNVGQRGQKLSPVCSGDNLPRLEAANARGIGWHRINREIPDVECDIREINAILSDLPNDDPARAAFVSERSFLRLDILTLRVQQARYRF